ncbi:MAG: hypothetical protein IJ525_01245 [Alphaproteobacteria bacterium]|nr:hypothetical protein [Alphaproteobacteria bacterium]
MKKINNQNGRSMIEMLGVLAIIGVLSVGGIAGYSKAMMKYRINKTIEQITLIAGNVRAFFASQKNYDGLDSANVGSDNGLALIKKAKLVNEEMIDENNEIVDEDLSHTHHIFNSFGGGVALWDDYQGTANVPGTPHTKYFQIIYFRLPQEVCIELVTQNWSNSAMGLKVLIINSKEELDEFGNVKDSCSDNNGLINGTKTIACPNGKTVPIPVPLDIAVDACNCPNNDCTIIWGFK